jgi:hypothetical protein
LPTKVLYVILISSMSATFDYHPIFLNSIVLIIFREAYKLWSSSLCSLLQSPVTSSLLCQNIFLNTLFSNTVSLCSSLSATGCFTPIQNDR